jgi:hypothetical protein
MGRLTACDAIFRWRAPKPVTEHENPQKLLVTMPAKARIVNCWTGNLSRVQMRRPADDLFPNGNRMSTPMPVTARQSGQTRETPLEGTDA